MLEQPERLYYKMDGKIPSTEFIQKNQQKLLGTLKNTLE